MSGWTSKWWPARKRPSTIHSGLHFIEHEKRSVLLAQCLRIFEVVAVRDSYSPLGLDRFHNEGRYAIAFELLFQCIKIPEWNAVGLRQHRAKSLAPKRIVH